MGSKKNVDMSANTDQVKIVVVEEPIQQTEEKSTSTKKTVKKSTRSKKYVAVRSQIDKTKTYDPFAAVELIKKLSYSKFSGSLEAHLIVREIGMSANLTFPHTTGKTIRVAIASDEILEKIEQGVIEFDVLVSSPKFMPKLSKLARVLGPKGLMPNPKNGTLTPNPELKQKELEGGAMTIKTEKKAPLMHLTVGKISMDTKDLVENLEALLKALKGKALKLSICASMSPSVKVKIE